MKPFFLSYLYNSANSCMLARTGGNPLGGLFSLSFFMQANPSTVLSTLPEAQISPSLHL
jgi:hypothetical protein